MKNAVVILAAALLATSAAAAPKNNAPKIGKGGELGIYVGIDGGAHTTSIKRTITQAGGNDPLKETSDKGIGATYGVKIGKTIAIAPQLGIRGYAYGNRLDASNSIKLADGTSDKIKTRITGYGVGVDATLNLFRMVGAFAGVSGGNSIHEITDGNNPTQKKSGLSAAVNAGLWSNIGGRNNVEFSASLPVVSPKIEFKDDQGTRAYEVKSQAIAKVSYSFTF